MNFQQKYDAKCQRLDALKARFDRGDRSDSLTREISNLLSQLESMDIQARSTRPAKRRVIDPDGPIGYDGSTSGPFRSFGEQMQEVRNAAMPGMKPDSRLFDIRSGIGLSESIPSGAGFLVQQDFVDELLHEVFETGLLAKRCRRFTIRGNSLKVPGVGETSRATGSRFGGVRGYWKDEGTAATASSPRFRLMELNPHKLVGLCYATEELLEDAPSLDNYLRNAFTSEFGWLIDEAIVNGTGAGQPLGIMNCGSTVQVAKEAGQANTTVVFDNVVKMWSRMIPNAMRDAVWLINPNIYPQLATMSLTVSSGGSAVFLPQGGASGAPFGTLLGRPILPIEQCQTLGTAGDIILSSFKQSYILGEKGGIKTDVSIHVQFLTDEQVFKWTLRIDGQPLLSQPISPANSSDDISHFVTLATRSGG